MFMAVFVSLFKFEEMFMLMFLFMTIYMFMFITFVHDSVHDNVHRLCSLQFSCSFFMFKTMFILNVHCSYVILQVKSLCSC